MTFKSEVPDKYRGSGVLVLTTPMRELPGETPMEKAPVVVVVEVGAIPQAAKPET
jgi:hypothetical protein